MMTMGLEAGEMKKKAWGEKKGETRPASFKGRDRSSGGFSRPDPEEPFPARPVG